MADSEPVGVQPPTVAEADGWTVTSSSIGHDARATAEEIVERIKDEPVAAPAETEAAAPETEAPTGETEARAGETEAPAAETPAQAKRKQTFAERQAELRARVDAETRAYHEARRAREAEEAAFERFRLEREQLAAPSSAPATLTDKPIWSKYEEEGKSYDTFLDDRDLWNRQQIAQALAQREIEQREQWQRQQQSQVLQSAEAQHQDRLRAAIQKHPDFLEVVNQNLSDVPESAFVTEMVKGTEQGAELLYHLAQHPDEARVLGTLQPARFLRDAIRRSSIPVELASYFAQHPQECDRLSRLHPADALPALGEVIADLKATGAKTGSPSAQTISHAKPPTRPVGGARAGTPANANDLPFGPEWIAAENRREREARMAARRL